MYSGHPARRVHRRSGGDRCRRRTRPGHGVHRRACVPALTRLFLPHEGEGRASAPFPPRTCLGRQLAQCRIVDGEFGEGPGAAGFDLGDGPDGGVDINIQHYVNTVTGTSTIFINNISTLQSVTGRGNTTNNKLIITDTSESTTTNVGALVVSGGIGVGKRVNCESLRIADSIFDSTLVTVATTATTLIDSFLSTEFRSAKYFIQISSGGGAGHTLSTATFQAVELILITDNVGTVYATEYGLVSTGGVSGGAVLGSFVADLSVIDNTARLYFTPNAATNKTIKVLRTSMAS